MTIAAAAARAVLETADVPEATAGPTGQLASPLRALGPDRAAVHWCAPGPPAGRRPAPGTGLARCQDALHTAGCHCELVITTNGGYLAVLPPKAKRMAPHLRDALSASLSTTSL